MNDPLRHPRMQRTVMRSRLVGFGLVAAITVAATAAILPVWWYVLLLPLTFLIASF